MGLSGSCQSVRLCALWGHMLKHCGTGFCEIDRVECHISFGLINDNLKIQFLICGTIQDYHATSVTASLFVVAVHKL